MSLEAAIICAAITLHQESRGESITGQIAVVHTLRNRAQYKPREVCPNAFRYKQFSWTLAPQTMDSDSFERAINIAQRAWEAVDITKGATHYHVRDGCPGGVKPYWIKDMVFTIEIGCHRFYRLKNARLSVHRSY